MKIATAFITLVLVLSGAVLFWLGSSGQVTDMATETYKTVLQLFVVAIAGNIISLLIVRAGTHREELKARDQFRKSIIERLTQLFMDTKSIRRLTRAYATDYKEEYPSFITPKHYNKVLEKLNDIQLRLEVVSKDVECSQKIFRDHESTQTNIDNLEEYLNEIIDEFEHTNPVPVGDPPHIALSDLPKLSDLIGPYKNSKFRTHFVKSYYIATDLIRMQLLYIGKNYSRKRPKLTNEN